MRGVQSKKLMQKARTERAGEAGVVDRQLVERGGRDATLVQSPWSIRALYQKLKAAFLRHARFAGEAKTTRARKYKPADSFKVKDDRPAAVIQKPLEFILGNCPPVQKKDPITGQDVVILHPTYVRARHAANRGDGVTVKRIAASFS